MSHLQVLKRRVDRYLASDANEVVNELDSEGGYLIVKGIHRRPVPPTLPALIGECLYQQRASLDFMACELARRNGKVVDKWTEWPIFLERDDFRNPVSGMLTPALKKRVGLIHPVYQAFIEDDQPFSGGYTDPKDDPLSWLYDLSNYDRHQFLNLTSVVTNESFHDFSPPEAAERLQPVNVSYGAFKTGAVIARFRILPGPSIDVKMDTRVRFNVAFSDGGPCDGRPVVNTLAEIGVRIGEMLDRLLTIPPPP